MSNDLFEKLIRLWRQRKNPTEALTPQEIAFHLFGKGSPENVTKTLHVLWGFKSYFTPPSSYGKKWRVNWTNVQRDYPDLVDMAPKTSGPLEGMMQALEDEIRAVKKDMQEHPFWAQGQEILGSGLVIMHFTECKCQHAGILLRRVPADRGGIEGQILQ